MQERKETQFDPWVGKIPGEGNSNQLQHSCLENSMDRGAWKVTVPVVTASDTTEPLGMGTHPQKLPF